MAFGERLAQRVRDVLGSRDGLDKRKMFGGLAFLLHGRMFCGIVKDELMVRVGHVRYAEALALPHARPMDFTGRPMKGMVYVAPAGLRGAALAGWVARGLAGLEEPSPPFKTKRQGPARKFGR